MDWFTDLVVEYVWSPVVDTFEYIWDFILYCFVKIWDLICDFTLTCCISVLDLFPDVDMLAYLESWDIASFFSLISTMDIFFPIVESFVLVSAFLFIVFNYALIKLVVKCIPTIG